MINSMRNFSVLLMMVLGISIFTTSEARTTEGGIEEVQIQTNAICGECKERLEDALFMVKGVKKANLDLETKVMTVEFKTNKTSLDEIKKVIVDTGYDADELKANSKVRSNLPYCCTKGGGSH